MAANSSSHITLEEIRAIHETDRKLYSFLTNRLQRDPFESMRVMALWLWLEGVRFCNIVLMILSLSPSRINEIADEAIAYMDYLANPNLIDPLARKIYLPQTQRLLGDEITAEFFFENRGSAFLAIGEILNEVCRNTLGDLMQQAVERNTARALAESQIAMSLIENRFARLSIGDSSRSTPRFHTLPEVVHPDDRTMFATFSRGYPIPEQDIREFFSVVYGDCIDCIHMQDVQLGEQSLYARIVFKTPNIIVTILNGLEKAKFTIKGRHIWVRKFVSKRRRPVSPPRPLLPRPGMPGAGSIPEF